MCARSMAEAGIPFLVAGFLAAAGCDEKYPQAPSSPFSS